MWVMVMHDHEVITVTSVSVLDGFGSVSGNYSLRLEVEVMVGHLSLAKLQTPTSLLHLLPLSLPNWKENRGHFSTGIRLRSENVHLNSWINIDSSIFCGVRIFDSLEAGGLGAQLTDKCNRRISLGAAATAK